MHLFHNDSIIAASRCFRLAIRTDTTPADEIVSGVITAAMTSGDIIMQTDSEMDIDAGIICGNPTTVSDI